MAFLVVGCVAFSSPHLRCFFLLCCRILFPFGLMGMKKRVSSVKVCMRKEDQGPDVYTSSNSSENCAHLLILPKPGRPFHGWSSEHFCAGGDVWGYINTWYHELIYFIFRAGRSQDYQQYPLPAVQLYNITGVQHPCPETLPSLPSPSLQQSNPSTHPHIPQNLRSQSILRQIQYLNTAKPPLPSSWPIIFPGISIPFSRPSR